MWTIWNLILHTRILYRIYHCYDPMLSDQLGEFFWLESTLHGPFRSVKNVRFQFVKLAPLQNGLWNLTVPWLPHPTPQQIPCCKK
jgi:hypothetical protein